MDLVTYELLKVERRQLEEQYRKKPSEKIRRRLRAIESKIQADTPSLETVYASIGT